tara:strand:- start:633 stop:755 length:123 start_codon:yes stop_codon:yes gene_type:complete
MVLTRLPKELEGQFSEEMQTFRRFYFEMEKENEMQKDSNI